MATNARDGIADTVVVRSQGCPPQGETFKRTAGEYRKTRVTPSVGRVLASVGRVLEV